MGRSCYTLNYVISLDDQSSISGMSSDFATVHRTSYLMSTWSYTSTPPYVFMVWLLIKHKDSFTVYFLLSIYFSVLALSLSSFCFVLSLCLCFLIHFTFLFLSDMYCAMMCEGVRVGSPVPPAVCLLSRRKLRPTEPNKTCSSIVPDGKVFILPETHDCTTLRSLLLQQNKPLSYTTRISLSI